MSFDGDVLVVGLGAVGAAALHQLARRGARVGGLDRFAPPHDQGSSHGESRITRLAVGEGDALVPFVRRSHTLWRELEAASGRSIYTASGGLVLASAADAPGPRGKLDFFRRTLDIAQRHGIRHELLDAADIRRRFPLFQLQGDERGYFEPEAGFVRPEVAIEVQLQLAAQAGAALHLHEEVLAIEPQGQRLAVHSRQGEQRHVHRADQVLLTAGAWLPGLLPPGLGWQPHFSVYRQVMFWFDSGLPPPAVAPGALPVFIWLFGAGDEDSFYGFPAADGSARVKVASAQYRASTSPETVDRRVAAAEVRAFVDSRLQGRLPFTAAQAVDARACLYTVTPDRQFVVDAAPGWPGLHLASACSGHGFKHSAAMGEALAERLLGLPPTLDLAPFAHARLAPEPDASAPSAVPA